ncbi:MAG: tetratricopeptide repeat protein [Methylophilaceae bacterium]
MSNSNHSPTPSKRLNDVSVEELTTLLSGDPKEAAQWIKAAAEQGITEAQALLGQILLDGRGLAKDEALARTWFAKAAESGHLIAVNMIGRCHENGWGGEIDMVEAAKYFRQAAAQGLDCAMYNYANLLLHGNGVKKDEQLALDWYRQAAARGYAKALGVMGRFYEEGWTVERNPELAAEYYQKSAEGGDFRGQYNHALILAENARMTESVEWMQKALAGAHLNFSRVMAENLSSFPHPEFHAVALQAFEKCCQSGDANDYFAYAQALLKHHSTSENAMLARIWLNRAADNGHAVAKQQLASTFHTSLN